MSRYASLADVRDYLGFSGTLGQVQDGLLQDCLNRAESAIDQYTRRNFAGTAGTVYYNRFVQDHQLADQALYLDTDLHTLVALRNGDETVIPVGSTWLEPQGQPPYRLIRLKSQYAWVWNTDSNVIISGTFGFSTVAPDDIMQATVRLASHYFRMKDAGGYQDQAGFPEAGEVTIGRGMPDDVRYALNPYRSRTGGIV